MMDVAMSLNFAHYCAKKKKDKKKILCEEIDLPTKIELLKLTEAIRPDYDGCCHVAQLYSFSCEKEERQKKSFCVKK